MTAQAHFHAAHPSNFMEKASNTAETIQNKVQLPLQMSKAKYKWKKPQKRTASISTQRHYECRLTFPKPPKKKYFQSLHRKQKADLDSQKDVLCPLAQQKHDQTSFASWVSDQLWKQVCPKQSTPPSTDCSTYIAIAAWCALSSMPPTPRPLVDPPDVR